MRGLARHSPHGGAVPSVDLRVRACRALGSGPARAEDVDM
jgi:hypothetical protein